MAGYNSMCEMLDARCKALVVPRRGPSAEQRIRSQIFSERRLVRVVDPEVLTPDRFSEELLQLLFADEIPDGASVPPLDGARRTANVLIHGVHAVQDDLPVVNGRRLPT
jgi:predicted glycosyltransferase